MAHRDDVRIEENIRANRRADWVTRFYIAVIVLGGGGIAYCLIGIANLT